MSDIFFVQLMKDADDDTTSDPEEFQRVARELQERLDRFLKNERIVQRGAFHASFGSTESSEEGSDTKNTQETEKAPPKSKQKYKRTETQFLETNILKKAVINYLVCGLREHSLAEY